MKLPDFLEWPELNALREKMGAELGNFVPAGNDFELRYDEAEQLAMTGIEIPSLADAKVLRDGTLAYKNSRVTVHSQDCVQSKDTSIKAHYLPRYHFSNCKEMENLRSSPDVKRYIVSNREDGRFEINIILPGTSGLTKQMEQLPICTDCMIKMRWKNFAEDLPVAAKKVILSTFTPRVFYEKYPKPINWLDMKEKR